MVTIGEVLKAVDVLEAIAQARRAVDSNSEHVELALHLVIVQAALVQVGAAMAQGATLQEAVAAAVQPQGSGRGQPGP